MELPRVVLKFGGTSIGDAEGVLRAVDRVQSRRGDLPIVVVSAANGVTNELFELAALASKSGWRADDGQASIETIRRRHRSMCRELDVEIPNILETVLEQIHVDLEAVSEEPARRASIVSAGERLLAPILSACLVRRGVVSKPWSAGDLGLVTDNRPWRARPRSESFVRIPQTLVGESDHVPVVEGFYARSISGRTTLLGRGGSDYSATLIARAVHAERVELWTDVDGIHTADPRVVPNTRRLDELGYREANELAYSGARVLHPQAMRPAVHGAFPVHVLDSRQPEAAGTRIRSDAAFADAGPPVRAIAHRSEWTIFRLRPHGPEAELTRHAARISNCFDRWGVPYDVLGRSNDVFEWASDSAATDESSFRSELEPLADVEMDDRFGTVSLIGLGAQLGMVTERADAICRSIDPSAECVRFGAQRVNRTYCIERSRIHDVLGALHREIVEAPESARHSALERGE